MINVLSLKIPRRYFKTSIESLTSVSFERSLPFSTLLSPCPLKSNAAIVANYLTSPARHAKLVAENPAP